jgi:hypothetical protein
MQDSFSVLAVQGKGALQTVLPDAVFATLRDSFTTVLSYAGSNQLLPIKICC